MHRSTSTVALCAAVALVLSGCTGGPEGTTEDTAGSTAQAQDGAAGTGSTDEAATTTGDAAAATSGRTGSGPVTGSTGVRQGSSPGSGATAGGGVPGGGSGPASATGSDSTSSAGATGGTQGEGGSPTDAATGLPSTTEGYVEAVLETLPGDHARMDELATNEAAFVLGCLAAGSGWNEPYHESVSGLGVPGSTLTTLNHESGATLYLTTLDDRLGDGQAVYAADLWAPDLSVLTDECVGTQVDRRLERWAAGDEEAATSLFADSATLEAAREAGFADSELRLQGVWGITPVDGREPAIDVMFAYRAQGTDPSHQGGRSLQVDASNLRSTLKGSVVGVDRVTETMRWV